jgi:LysM repeat protein
MRLAPIAAGFALAAVFTLAGGPSAHAQDRNSHKTSNKYVTVSEGDTLEAIATQNDTTYVRLFDANTKIKDPDLIYPGDKVWIPSPVEKLPSRELPSNVPVATAPVSTVNYQSSSTQAYAPVAPRPVASSPVSGCGDNKYASFIYSHESGCRTSALSPNGCYGIGQACSGSKIAYCGADYSCQNAYFTSYANSKYGGWAGAYSFWQSHGWW